MRIISTDILGNKIYTDDEDNVLINISGVITKLGYIIITQGITVIGVKDFVRNVGTYPPGEEQIDFVIDTIEANISPNNTWKANYDVCKFINGDIIIKTEYATYTLNVKVALQDGYIGKDNITDLDIQSNLYTPKSSYGAVKVNP